MRKTLAMLLAGGVGSRLNILAHYRAKPAVPFGGLYRIIDFTLSNVKNSGLINVGILTQYKPLSLMDHIGDGQAWDLIGRMRGAKILPPSTGAKDSDWYKGTADAIRQNAGFIRNFESDRVLILSGDHIYHMDYSRMTEFHKNRGADLTIAMMRVPMDQTRHFGIGITDKDDRLIDWEEKPKEARSTLASIGVYVFNTDFLFHCLNTIPAHDFGKDMIPYAINSHKVYAFPFAGYWRDVGTLHSYWDANMDLLRHDSGLRLSDWKIYTNLEEEGRGGDRAPTCILKGAHVANCFVAQGCVIAGTVTNSVLSPGVVVGKNAVIDHSVIMHDSIIEEEVQLSYVIADKQSRFQRRSQAGFGDPSIPNRKTPEHLREGLTVIGKNAVVPENTRLGKNCIVHPLVGEGHFPGAVVADGTTIELFN
jgi:glucose-1-phosphate adenylyltransferase